MKELLVEIFNHFLERDEEAKEMQNRVNLELERMLIPYKNNFTEEEKEKEKVYTFLYDVAYTAEREGTLYGLKLLMRLMLEL